MNFIKVRSKLVGSSSLVSEDKFSNLRKTAIKYKLNFSPKIIRYSGFVTNNKPMLQLRWDCHVIHQESAIYHFDSESNFYIEAVETCSSAQNLINIINHSYGDYKQNFEEIRYRAKSFPSLLEISSETLESSLSKLNKVLKTYLDVIK